TTVDELVASIEKGIRGIADYGGEQRRSTGADGCCLRCRHTEQSVVGDEAVDVGEWRLLGIARRALVVCVDLVIMRLIQRLRAAGVLASDDRVPRRGLTQFRRD